MLVKRLGERLLESAAISKHQLEEALQAQAATGEQLGEVLVRLGHVDADSLMRVLCEEAGIPFHDLQDVRPDPKAAAMIPEPLARVHNALPLRIEEGRVTVVLGNPFDIGAVMALERATGRPVTVLGGNRDRIAVVLEQAYHPELQLAPEYERVSTEVSEESGTALKLVDEIVQRGVSMGATDIHLEPHEAAMRVRYRLDGLLQEASSYPKALQSAIITRLKIMAELNIAESRMPQDGRIRVEAQDHFVDLRISTFPTMHGEDVVLRILDRGRVALDLERLGMVAEDVALCRKVLQSPHGLVAVTGPTGSGKTTTLYSALTELNTGSRCVLTLEDPIEYELEGIRQSQINVRAGLTFASGLRSLLRHDPDVILVGEMRDEETVQIGLSAALTGHLVLTTLHTNTASGAIPRLLDMGAEPFVLSSALRLVVAQRLVRRICPACKQRLEVPAAVRERYGLQDVELFHGRGCKACRQTGFRGRIGIFELLPVTEAIVACIFERRSAEEIERRATRPVLLDDGLAKVRAGITSLDELLRVTVG